MKEKTDTYDMVVAAAKRARDINDWRRKREDLLLDDPDEKLPKVIAQVLEEIADGTVKVARRPKEKGE